MPGRRMALLANPFCCLPFCCLPKRAMRLVIDFPLGSEPQHCGLKRSRTRATQNRAANGYTRTMFEKPTDPENASTSEDPSARVERANFATFCLYQVLMRIGWIFKTESIVMPAVLDTLSGSPTVRSLLPMFNRLGQSVIPVWFAPAIRGASLKKRACLFSASAMALAFGGFSTIWFIPGLAESSFAVPLFLVCYGLFFACLGINQTAQMTVQAKLVPLGTRGRLLAISNAWGSIGAVVAAAIFFPLWLRPAGGDFQYLFGSTALLFAAAAFVTTRLQEDRDTIKPRGWEFPFARSWEIVSRDRHFQRAAMVAFLFGTSTVLFPHYQALAQQRLGVDFRRMIGWVIVQNLGTGLFSWPIGKLADRRGTRFVMQVILLGTLALPLVALGIARIHQSIPHVDGSESSPLAIWSDRSFTLVFLLIGLNPVVLRMFNEHAIELSRPEDHPFYVSTMSLCITAPILLSPVAGWAIGRWGFEPVFLVVDALIATAWLLTFWLHEPRESGGASVENAQR